MTLKEAILSGKRHRRPYMADKWMPRSVKVGTDMFGINNIYEFRSDEFTSFQVLGYMPTDVLAEDWEVEP